MVDEPRTAVIPDLLSGAEEDDQPGARADRVDEKLGSVQLSVAEEVSPPEEKPKPVGPRGVDASELQR